MKKLTEFLRQGGKDVSLPRFFRGFLCVFAPLREKNSSLAGTRLLKSVSLAPNRLGNVSILGKVREIFRPDAG